MGQALTMQRIIEDVDFPTLSQYDRTKNKLAFVQDYCERKYRQSSDQLVLIVDRILDDTSINYPDSVVKTDPKFQMIQRAIRRKH